MYVVVPGTSCFGDKPALKMASSAMTGLPTSPSSFFFVFLLLSTSGLAAVASSVERWQLFPGGRHGGDAGVCAALVTPSGYKCQEFNVKTQDGYILSMQRIPEGRNEGAAAAAAAAAGQTRRPVLLQHGVLLDGMSWLINSPEESLAYILADSGFDVWIANTRGTRWSRRHETLDPSSPAFWSWSWDELVMYDLPATFDFVYQQTGQKLDYVGHSMGTLMALASFSERRLVDKLRSAALLSPVAYLSHMTTPVGILAARAFLDKVYTWLGIAEFNPKGLPVVNLLKWICLNPALNCYNLMASFTGTNCCLNESTVELFLKYEPQSTSTRNMVHLAQSFRDGNLAKFDYGNFEANLRHYGRETPPAYNMSNIPGDVPLFLSYGGRDCLSDVKDVQILLDKLKYHELTVQYVADYAHVDFVMGTSAKEVVYDALIAFFNRQT